MSDNRRALSQPWAQQVQADTQPADYALTDAARLLRPTVRWWWGVRRSTRGAYAECYLCGAIVTTWASAWPMPQRSRDHILEHRHSEHVRLALKQATRAAGSAGGEGNTEGVPE